MNIRLREGYLAVRANWGDSIIVTPRSVGYFIPWLWLCDSFREQLSMVQPLPKTEFWEMKLMKISQECKSRCDCPSISRSLRDKWDIQGDIPLCHIAQFSVPLVHPIPMSLEGMSYGVPQDNCLSHHPSVPKGHMGHQEMFHGIPQHNSLSHLSIPSLSPQGTYGTSRDVLWCPSTQYCIHMSIHPLVPRGMCKM